MTRLNVLVLRPERAAARTASALEAIGCHAILAPVLSIEDLPAIVPDGPFDAVLATSANGLRKLSSRPEIERLRDAPLIAVGDRTAEAGREAGFATVHVAEGDGRALVADALRLFRAPARFLHAAGADRAFDVAGALTAEGHRVEIVELYKAQAVTALPEPAVRAIAFGAAGAVLHHSGRIAATFVALADAAGLGAKARAIPQVTLAERISAPLREAGFAEVATAASPDERALLKAFLDVVGDGSPSASGRTN